MTSHILNRITALALIALAGLALLYLVAGQTWAAFPAQMMLLALTVLVTPRFGLREWALAALAIALAFGLIWYGLSVEIFDALDKAAYFAAFIALLMLLRQAAITSDAVLAVGHWISHQPPGRRFVTTWFGGHLAGILMNFGAVSLLAPLIQRGVRADPIKTEEDERRAQIREQRQLSALVRGFSPVITWAPTSLTQVIVLAAVPGIDPIKAMFYGLSLAISVFAIGWVEDRLNWGPPRIAPAPVVFPKRSGVDLLIVYGLLILGSGLVILWLNVPLPQALMTVSPLMLVGWVWSQNKWSLSPTRRRLGEIAVTALPDMAINSVQMALAAFIGIAAARLAPVDLIAEWTEARGIPGWVMVAGLPILITLAGQIALSPMMMVVFLAAVLSALPALPAEPEFIAVALAAGWMLSLTASPNATGALLISAGTGIAPIKITWIWNGRYSLLVIAALTLAFWLLIGA
ncbi:MAG: hypothetical protein AAF557_15120 [Pseudomonadota bacterium]